MLEPLWQNLVLPSGDEDLFWEAFHENSKNSHYNKGLSEEDIQTRVRELHESLDFVGRPIIPLPRSLRLRDMTLDEAIRNRNSLRQMRPCPITLQGLATILYSAYGVTRPTPDSPPYRSFRTVPSGGGLYPLEVFLYCAHVRGLQPGVYHYSPSKNHLRFLREGDHTAQVSDSLMQPEIAVNASVIMFITALFERSVFKYRDRGYRYILIEAGHAAQNINLVTTVLGLGSVNIGGFYDREVDAFLCLDGVTHSTIYMIAIGRKVPSATARECGQAVRS